MALPLAVTHPRDRPDPSAARDRPAEEIPYRRSKPRSRTFSSGVYRGKRPTFVRLFAKRRPRRTKTVHDRRRQPFSPTLRLDLAMKLCIAASCPPRGILDFSATLGEEQISARLLAATQPSLSACGD